MAIQAVTAAFRTGVHVTDTAKRLISTGDDFDQSWSIIVPGSDSANLNPASFAVIPLATTADHLIYAALKKTSLCNLLAAKSSTPSNAITTETSSKNTTKSKLAIIGMSGRYPAAKDNEAFWDLLVQGLDVHKAVPAFHWDEKSHVDPAGLRKNTSATPFGCWLDDPAGFDARFFNISPREAPQIDPAQRLALMTAYEAMEQAGLVADATPSTRPDRIGVFYGVTSNDWMETNSAQDIDTYFIPGGNRAFIPGRINYCFKFSGPSYAVDTACSSSLAGIHLACNSLWRRDIDTAIAGGTNVLTNPDFTAGLDRGHFLSRTGNCKTFDDDADGYCRGEGIGTIIIKRLDDALADNDPILGVILGANTNHSAESESITRPHSGAQRAIFTKILNQAAVDPYSVSYIEMHGTGTQAGDAGEMSSVLDTFAPSLPQVKKLRTDDEVLYLGSAKANIGHGEAASGVSSVIKVLLMMQKNMIVPHCGIKTHINRKFPTDLRERNVRIALQPQPWHRGSDHNKPRRVFVNNFSAAGGNSALLIEDAPRSTKSLLANDDSRTVHIVAISAKSGASLQGNLKSMYGYLERNSDVPLGQLSFTTTARRIHHPNRVLLTGSSSREIGLQIQKALEEGVGVTRPKGGKKVVFVFTGQGAQYPGMGMQLFESFSIFRTELRHLDNLVQSTGFPSILPVIHSCDEDINVFPPLIVQLASVCIQIALSKLWTSWNITPSAVLGHSLGEYAALNVAGVLSDAEVIYLVAKRAELLQARCVLNSHSMLVVKASVNEIKRVLGSHKFELACINSPVETVLAGSHEDIFANKHELAVAGIKSVLLKVPYAFHSSQMDPVLSDFKALAAGVTFSKPKIPVICPLDGGCISRENVFNSEYLMKHTRQPVNVIKALESGSTERIISDQSIMLEVGPHPAVSSMVKAVLGTQMTCIASLQRGKDIWQVLGAALKSLYTSGVDIRWAEYHRDFKSSHKVIPLPAYSWDLKNYWMQYVNDWSLRKGDPIPALKAAPSLESTTIHRIVEEVSEADKTHLIVEADIVRKDLSPLVQGHEVDGVPLCTPSVYADIALTIGTYLSHRKESLVNISGMTISKALVLRAGTASQLLQSHAEADWMSQTVSIKFMSFDSRNKLQEHARCVVRYEDRSIQDRLQKDLSNIQGKLDKLRAGIANCTTARFNRPMVYRAIRPLARFHDNYRAIDEIVLNSDTLEASSRLSFASVKQEGNFHTHPAIIDSLTQSCGFTMNCNDSTDLDAEVFMNHGWGSFHIFEPLDFSKEYTTYTRMQEGVDKLWHGDVVVLDGDCVVAHFGSISIQGVPRRVLKVILSLETGSKYQKQQQAVWSQPAAAAATPTVSSLQAPEVSFADTASARCAKALSIIAEESQISIEDLTDETAFADVGIDSLLGLTISARIKDELDEELDFDALFTDYATVGDLRAFFGGPVGIMSTASTSVTGSPKTSTTRATTPSADVLSPDNKGGVSSALMIISEESGVAIDDLTDDTNFADVGIDSLLSLIVVSRLRDELDIDIQHESLFLECPTVLDLKRLITGSSQRYDFPQDTSDVEPDTVQAAEVKRQAEESVVPLQSSTVDPDILATRKKAIDAYLERYGSDYPAPTSSPTSCLDDAKVILVTGATGNLGCHLVYHLAQLSNVKTVICLNRENRSEPNERQEKAMREKGIRFPDAQKHKLLIYQTKADEPILGLSQGDYESIVCSATHIIHNAWPMSAKRPLAAFEAQFQVLRNLVNLARDVMARRPDSFKFSFQMVSSIGVVGHYGLGNEELRTVVPESRVGIECVLPNGYSEAKWGCERLLDQTLHKYPSRFRTMVVRLGQIAGSKTSGYWPPMEHFGFLIKSSQTLNALPDVDGTVHWTPVNEIAGTLSDLVLSDHAPQPLYHVDNPVGQSWRDMNAILAKALRIPNLIPFGEWIDRVRTSGQKNNPAATLLEFLDSNYLRMSCGGLVLDVGGTLAHSPTLANVGPVSEEVVRRYIHVWKEIGFLNF
ncbi:hypothetical protein MBLNU459_g0810t2 [Dothideomycetes sp. NU459]